MPILRSSDLDCIRKDACGPGAILRLYTTRFENRRTEEDEIGTYSRGWVIWRKARELDAVDQVQILIARSTGIDVCKLAESGYADIKSGGTLRKYRVFEVSETQDLSGGWVLRCSPAERIQEKEGDGL